MQKNYQLIQSKNAELFAISVEDIPTTKRTVVDENLEFPVLSDLDLEAVKTYNVENQEFPGFPRASTFLLESDGTIVWKSLDTVDRRVSTAIIMKELGKLW